ncbi:uncharacterized protein LOC106142700 [Amyelois transitella]|uniref:uncharacterized protein LOC106142700 n=1 Tax=Amyelois transitella TaxID=680683 RepID=UPI00067E0181|nr:uncharacterized protein LOC106142700 [Amyelois transitella]
MAYKVWSEFQRTKIDGSVLKFSVQDLTPDRMDEVIDIYSKYFIEDESIYKLSGASHNDKARNECIWLVNGMLKEKGIHIVVCVEESNDLNGKVVAVSSMKLNTSSENGIPDITFETKEMNKLWEILQGMMAMYNVATSYSVDLWYDGRGVIVHPSYRCIGIATELVASRRKICKENGVPVSTAWMTSIGTQKAAQKDLWDTPFEIDTKEFCKKFDVTPYDGIAPTFKLMAVKVEI